MEIKINIDYKEFNSILDRYFGTSNTGPFPTEDIPEYDYSGYDIPPEAYTDIPEPDDLVEPVKPTKKKSGRPAKGAK